MKISKMPVLYYSESSTKFIFYIYFRIRTSFPQKGLVSTNIVDYLN